MMEYHLLKYFWLEELKKKCVFFHFRNMSVFFPRYLEGGVHVCVKYIIDKQQVAPRQEKVPTSQEWKTFALGLQR